MTFFLFVLGFVLLIYGANWLVDGAASIAGRRNISHVVIGMTIVALGTSAPELVVNLVASYKETADVAVGNILGSNIANILLVLGASAIIFPVSVNNNTARKEVPFALMGAFIIWVLANDSFIDGVSQSMIYRSDGIILLCFFVLFLHYAYGIAHTPIDASDKSIKDYSLLSSVILVIAGIGGLIIGGNWIVEGAIHIALIFGMSEAVISLTIVAMGTSLPELATCVAAAMKKNSDIIIGNVLGSNIFNIFFVLGISSVVRPLPFNRVLNFDLLTGIFVVAILWGFIYVSGRNTLTRLGGTIFLLLYVTYITYLLLI